MYINDLCYIPESLQLAMYADDTNNFFKAATIPDLELKVNYYMKQLSSWLRQNKLQMNTSKTKYMIFVPFNKPRNFNATIAFGDRIIEQVKCQKFLGVWFQKDLAWNMHVDKTVTELSKSVGCLYRLSTLVPPSLKISFYIKLYFTPDQLTAY